ncbi:MAG: hypothetical protein EXS64_04645 [Candidatus Latescibacteria bacterium]|nr:hypothetical protein [Candidatus Latescibacterota bacterium]
MEKLQKLKREQAVLTHQLDTLNGRLQAGDRTVRAQISAINRQLTTINEQIESLTGEKEKEA